jgi:hypothetical protein
VSLAIDLWHPAGFDAHQVRRWAEVADCIAVAWDADGWSWAEFYGGDGEHGGFTTDPVDLIEQLRIAATALGEDPAALGGRGLAGWRD